MALQRAADQRAANILPVIAEIKQAGAVTSGQIAAQLTARNIRTARGGPWTATSVKDLLERAPGAP